MTPLLATSIALSLGLVALSINCIMLTRWISRLSQRVLTLELDLKYPLQAAAKRRTGYRDE